MCVSQAIVDEDVRKAQESAAAANAIKTECEDALAEAIPILVSADTHTHTRTPCTHACLHCYSRRVADVVLNWTLACHLYPYLQESALAALDTIKPADIKLVQSFKNPPGAIKLVRSDHMCVSRDLAMCALHADPAVAHPRVRAW